MFTSFECNRLFARSTHLVVAAILKTSKFKTTRIKGGNFSI